MNDRATAPTAQQFRMADNAQKAMALAAAGVPVFPCHAGPKKTKAPLTAHGFRDASDDTATVAEWWARWPTALIGIVPGDVGAVVIDLDVKNGRDGLTAFRAMEPNWHEWPATRTLSGGEHVWAARPSDARIGNATGALPAGIDIRCDSGYVCLGQTEDGREYEDLGGVFETLLDPEGVFPALPAAVAKALAEVRPAATSAHRDYTAESYPAGYAPTTLSDLHAHSPSLDGWKGEGDDRSRDAFTWLCKAVVALCQAREIDAKDVGEAEVKNLCELAIEAEHDFLEHYVDRGYGKLGYDAERAADWAADQGIIHIPNARQTRYAEADAAKIEPLEIYIRQGALTQNIERCEAYLVKRGVELFDRGGMLVRPIAIKMKTADGNVVHVPALTEVTPEYLHLKLARYITFLRPQATPKGVIYVEADPPHALARMMLSNKGHWPYSVISGIIATPTLRPDGSVLDAPGYDEATGVYLVPGVTLPCDMPTHPTREDALAAADRLDALLDDFPFVDGASWAVGMSCLITPVVRPMMTVAPMHMLSATAPGTGKSYLMDTASMIALGTKCPVMAAGANEEELEKRLGAEYLAGSSLISIDNVEADLGGTKLCQDVERPIIKVRKLGVSEQPSIVNKATVFANGNNIRVRGDMVRRAICATLDAGMEHPHERRFKGDPVAAVSKDRGGYVADCLTIVRAYALSPARVAVTPFGSFSEWSRLVREALIWLGYDDPVATMEAVRENDPETQQHALFISAFKNVIGGYSDAATTGLIAEKAIIAGGKMASALQPWIHNGTVNTRSFGKWLAKKEKRVISGHSIERRKKDGEYLWFIAKGI